MKRGLCEVRFHGRGGQGAWTASLLLAHAGLREKKFVQSFPSFGPERAGAPITAFTRISDDPIHLHSGIYEPDVVVVLDPTLLGLDAVSGLKKGKKIVVNTDLEPNLIRGEFDFVDVDLWVIDASSLALKILGRPITNTAMLGSFVKATGIVALDSLIEVVRERFTGKMQELNVEIVNTAYEEVRRG